MKAYMTIPSFKFTGFNVWLDNVITRSAVFTSNYEHAIFFMFLVLFFFLKKPESSIDLV